MGVAKECVIEVVDIPIGLSGRELVEDVDLVLTG